MSAANSFGRPLLAGAIDTHFHVFGPEDRYPYAAGRSYTPPDAGLEAWQAIGSDFGITGGVLVQASVHGLDNSQISDTMRGSPNSLRGVAAVAPDVEDRQLADLDALGFRGARVNTIFASGTVLETAQRLAPRLRSTSWHLEFLSDVSRIANLRKFVEALGVPVVFAHFGHVRADHALNDPGFRDLLGLVSDGLAWVKLSGPARITARDFPPYEDVAPLAEALCTANPHRLLWGSDWPHTSITRRAPSMAELAEMAHRWLPNLGLAKQVLVTNPRELYGFHQMA